MKKYMVLIPNQSPEYIEAEEFAVTDTRTLELYIDGKRTAAFDCWIGIKEINPVASASVTATTSTSNPTRAKITIR